MTKDPQGVLFDAGPADGALTDNQRAIYNAIGTGMTASEAGALLHSRRAVHPASDRCQFCRGEGNALLQALRKRQLVKRRRNGTWQLVRSPPGLLPGQTDVVPF